MRIEWRYRNPEDALLTVDEEGNTALEVWEVNRALLSDFLNLMTSLDTYSRRSIVDDSQRIPRNGAGL